MSLIFFLNPSTFRRISSTGTDTSLPSFSFFSPSSFALISSRTASLLLISSVVTAISSIIALKYSRSVVVLTSILVRVSITCVIFFTVSFVFSLISATAFLTVSSFDAIIRTSNFSFIASRFSRILFAFSPEFSNLSLIKATVSFTVVFIAFTTSLTSCAAISPSCLSSVILSARDLLTVRIVSISSSLSKNGAIIFFISSGVAPAELFRISFISSNWVVMVSFVEFAYS